MTRSCHYCQKVGAMPPFSKSGGQPPPYSYPSALVFRSVIILSLSWRLLLVASYITRPRSTFLLFSEVKENIVCK